MPFRSLRSLRPALHPLAASLIVGAAVAAISGAQARPAASHPAGGLAAVTPTTTPTRTTVLAMRPAPAPARVARRSTRSRHSAAWVRPAKGPVTSGFGPRWGSFHPGIDIGARYGSPVRAITGGRILSAGWISGYGKTVRVRAHGLVFYYPHLSRILRRHGLVATGALLGRVGSTGYSTGPHLHVEIRRHGHPINPRPVLRRHGVRL